MSNIIKITESAFADGTFYVFTDDIIRHVGRHTLSNGVNVERANSPGYADMYAVPDGSLFLYIRNVPDELGAMISAQRILRTRPVRHFIKNNTGQQK